MAYRGSRFETDEGSGLAQVWKEVDRLEAEGLPVRTETLAGNSYRRRLREVPEELEESDYLLQVVFSVPKLFPGKRAIPEYYIDESRRLLSGLDLPGEINFNRGGLNGSLALLSGDLPFGSTGRTEDDVVSIYPPWIMSKWQMSGKACVAAIGIEPPLPRHFLEGHPVPLNETAMRHGNFVFEPTPQDLASR
ncbi:MAG TPA: hypothetical protein VD947_04820 [Patescibacteria group bacterium]|nr:hypothetical protein [Patescibacteria group bacterium]